MKRLLLLFSFSLGVTTVHCMNQCTNVGNQKKKSINAIIPIGVGLPMATIVSGVLGDTLHNKSGALPYTFPMGPALIEKINVVEYPPFYSLSMEQYYMSRCAKGLLTFSSACSAPFRSLLLAPMFAVGTTIDYMCLYHCMKNPQVNDSELKRMREIQDSLRPTLRGVFRKSRAGAGLIVSIIALNKFQRYRNNKS